MSTSLLIRNIKSIVQIASGSEKIVKGADMAHLPCLNNAYLLLESGKIKDFGPMQNCPERAAATINAEGRLVLPCWCDSHTHLVYATGREEEFVDRIRGMSYEEIAARGGGILNSARKMQAASETELFEAAWQRLEEVISFGTGAIEIKSGYGLTTESELKMLRVIRQLKEKSPIPVKATFLGAHAIPALYKENRAAYIRLLVEEMLPQVAGEGLADYCDVFCDKGFFTPEETDQILKSAQTYGLKAKIHANELGLTGGVQTGVANNAISVDHLEHCGPDEIRALQSGTTIPTLLPSCAFFLGIPYPPARAMIDAGLPVALATDYNPGSSPSGNMPFVLALACIKLKMLPEEAIHAATLNGAYAMELEAQAGSIAKGKTANLFITKPVSGIAQLPYYFGSQLIDSVIINGNKYC